MVTFTWLVSLVLVAVFGFLNNRYSPWWFVGIMATITVELYCFKPAHADFTWYAMYVGTAFCAMLLGAKVSEAGWP